MMPPFVVFPTKRIAYFVEVSLYFILSSTTSEINIWLCDHPCKRRKSGTLSESLQKQKSLYGKDSVQRGRPAYGTNAGR